MFRIVLYEPEIPPNTGNIIRLCANTGCELHLVAPLGFQLEDKQLRRAGLDYREFASVQVHENYDTMLSDLGGPRTLLFTTKGNRALDRIEYATGDALVFGPESRGLPDHVLASVPGEQRIRIPMRPESRSLNLSNAVAIAVYEAWRQHGYRAGD